MPHPRQVIREAMKSLLLAGNTAAEERVFTTRLEPYRHVELPAVSVFTLAETSNSDTKTSPRKLTRVMQLAVECTVDATENVDDALDDFALEVENIVHADETLGNLVDSAVLDSTDVDVLVDGDREVGVVRMEFAVTYRTNAFIEAPLDDFNTADVRHGTRSRDIFPLE